MADSNNDTPPSSQAAETDFVFPKRNREMMKYLITTFAKLLDPKKQAEFMAISGELGKAIDNNCDTCAQFRAGECAPGATPKDPRRQRFLLRLVVGHVSSLFFGAKPIFPRAVVEGIDIYLRKSLGDIIYEELNKEADSLLYKVNTNDDAEMVSRIAKTPEWRRFADTIFIRIALRFENLQLAKRSFITVIDMAVKEQNAGGFSEDGFHTLFDAMFHEVFERLQEEDARVRMDYMFGEGTSKKLALIQQMARKKLPDKTYTVSTVKKR